MSSYRDDFRRAQKEATWTFWRILWAFVLIGIVVSAVGFMLNMLSKPAQVIDKVTNPDRIIFNYEYFFETYHDCQALDDQIVTAQKALDSFTDSLNNDRNSWAREDRTEWNRLNTVVLGLRTQRDSVIQDYNAKSKELTRNLFKDNNLPYQLEVRDDKTVGAFD